MPMVIQLAQVTMLANDRLSSGFLYSPLIFDGCLLASSVSIARPICELDMQISHTNANCLER